MAEPCISNIRGWDTGGYWSGPYTRAQWSSSIGSETIRIYEHSSYSEQYNNGIYLIQESSSSTPTQPTLITSIPLTGGVWNPASYIHQATDNTNTYYEYKISLDTTDSQYFIAYNWTTKKWFDTNTTTTHSTFGTSVSDTSSTSRETTENAAVVYVMASNALHAQFTNPYYEPPTVVSPLPVLSQHTQAFGMEYYQTVGTKYYYKSDSHTGTGTSITYDYETKTWNDEGSQVPYHLNTTSTFASTTSLVNPAEIHGFGSQQNHNGTRYFSVSNPYYEAPIVEPEILTSVGSYAWSSINEYRHRLSTATHEIYDLWNVANDDWDRTDDLHSIAVDISTNTWEDYGDATPNIVVENADGTVSVSHDTATDIRYKFVKPTSASWL